MKSIRKEIKGTNYGKIAFLLMGIGSCFIIKALTCTIDFYEDNLPTKNNVTFLMQLPIIGSAMIGSLFMVLY
jgi:hypothetical protein